MYMIWQQMVTYGACRGFEWIEKKIEICVHRCEFRNDYREKTTIRILKLDTYYFYIETS